MNLDHVRGALVHSRAKGSSRLVLTILATFADNQRCAWPAVSTIAALANVSERRVQTALAELVGRREIEIITPGGGRNRPTKYRLTLQTCSPFQLTERVKSLKGVSRQRAGRCSKGERVNPYSPEVLKAHGATRAVFLLSSYSEEERAVIDLYHGKLVNVTSGWLSVRIFTKAVREAIAHRSLPQWREFFEDYAQKQEEWPDRRTFVRLAWHNY